MNIACKSIAMSLAILLPAAAICTPQRPIVRPRRQVHWPQGLATVDKENLPTSAAALRYLDDGRILAVDHRGEEVSEISEASSGTALRGVVLPDKAKEILGACLGFAWEGGPLAEAIFRSVYNVKTAIKFLVRRLGLGAVSACAGGIVWHYL